MIICQNKYVLYFKGKQNYHFQDNKILQINNQLRWVTNLNIENVQIMNQLSYINQTNRNYIYLNIILEFKSLSSNNTNFVSLSMNNSVLIYKWKNKQIMQIGLKLNINVSFNCYSVHLSMLFNILLDCYQNNQFYFMNIMQFFVFLLRLQTYQHQIIVYC
ncbi:unnamed protein product [Paramecium sonneborni]|uniref:Uncharacterized protein n=1 Tax=Paramecium sonneborni TaxID=65129 RepID=A0A8S1R9J4_9CILI|nr:unnamed protein product [Paramecium sonneborni]